MNLSFKDLKFILEALKHLLNRYDTKLKEIEHEDEASDLGNDCLFLESLKSEIEENIAKNNSIEHGVSSKSKDSNNLESLIKYSSHLSINERLLLVEAITQSIRKETNLIAS